MIDTSALEPGTVVAGRYRIVRKIGHGGMGAVYEVSHVHTDERLALKVLHPQVLRDDSAVERFRREARAPARITSEHVARVTDADTAADLDGAPFYVMELLVGRDLERILADEGPLPATRVCEYFRQVARALDKAHGLGIVHRDLKPENLFLTHREDGSPCLKLLDFGIARLASQEAGPLMTQGGYVFGTPNYMAPEQATGNAEQISAATDIWALGLVAFKLLVGVEFFTGKTAAHLYAQILAEPLPTPSARGSAFGPDFDTWFARCVARSIPDRFASAGDAARELAIALRVRLSERPSIAEFSQTALGIGLPAGTSAAPNSGDAAAPGTFSVPTMLPAGVPSRPRWILAAVGVAFAAVVVTALVVTFRSGPTRAPQGIVATQLASAESSDVTPPPSLPSLPSSTGSTPAPLAIASAAPVTPHRSGDAKTRSSTTKANSAGDGTETLSRAQRKRLDALERLCSQGTYTVTECQSKRQTIIHGGS